MSLRSFKNLLGFGVLLFNLAACGPTVLNTGEGACDPQCDEWEKCVAGSCQKSCISDDECGANAFCIESICHALTPCQDTGQCEADASCLNGFCIPLNRQCVNDSACGDQICVNGVCIDDTEEQSEEENRCTSDADCPAGQNCAFGFCEGGDSDGTGDGNSDGTSTGSSDGNSNGGGDDNCNGNDDGQLGDSCDEASDCCNGLCLGDPSTNQGFCTEMCSTYSDCNPVGFNLNMWCLDAGADGSLCAFSDYEEPCESTSDCVGQICLVSVSNSSCSINCNSGSMCPPGAACGMVSASDGAGGITTIQTCTPIGESCAVANDCLSGTCIGDDETGVAYCSTFCAANDPNACPSNYACTLVQGSDLPVCVR